MAASLRRVIVRPPSGNYKARYPAKPVVLYLVPGLIVLDKTSGSGRGTMRGILWPILGIATICIASPAQAVGRYDSNYPVCMEAYGSEGSRIECFFMSIEQCKASASGSSGTCFNNPTYVAPPAPAAEDAATPPPASPAGSKKKRH
jgi:uncharacterized protein DUF3551